MFIINKLLKLKVLKRFQRCQTFIFKSVYEVYMFYIVTTRKFILLDIFADM